MIGGTASCDEGACPEWGKAVQESRHGDAEGIGEIGNRHRVPKEGQQDLLVGSRIVAAAIRERLGLRVT